MQRSFIVMALLGLTLTVSSQVQKTPAAGVKNKAVEKKVYAHRLMSPYYSVLSQDATIQLQKSICTQYEKELQQYLGLGTSQSHKIAISYINAGGSMLGYSFFNEVYEGGNSTGANILLASTPGSPDAFIKIKIEGDKIKQAEITNLKTGQKITEQLDEPKFNLSTYADKQIQLLANKNMLSGTGKASQTGFAKRPASDPLEDNLEKKHGVLFLSDYYEFQTPGGATGLIYKHNTEKGNYKIYTHYVTDMKGNPLINPFTAPSMPKYGEVYDLTYTTISDGKTHNLKLAYGVAYFGAVLQQLIAEGYLK